METATERDATEIITKMLDELATQKN